MHAVVRPRPSAPSFSLCATTDPVAAHSVADLEDSGEATLDELSSRFDVRRQVAQHVPGAWPVVIAVGALLAAVVVWRRRSSRRPGE